MRSQLSMARCPNCGAPLSVDEVRCSVICIFCNASLRVERPATATEGAALAAVPVPADEIERVKQMLVDGRREEAIDHCARIASVSRAEAEKAVEGVYLSAYWTLTRHVPINAFGFLLYGVLVSLGAGPAAWAATGAAEEPGFFVLVGLGGLFALYQLYRFGQHLRSTWVANFGARGRGRVVRRAVVREIPERQAYLIVVAFEVVPEAGGPAFVDQETLFVGAASLEKLAPGNIVPVRFDGARERVFPITPMRVIGVA